VSNAAFYRCAAEKTDDEECKLLFKALGKIEGEHAAIWRKVLGLSGIPAGNETCHVENLKNLNEYHERRRGHRFLQEGGQGIGLCEAAGNLSGACGY
jgi:hypothetical protein